MISWIGRSWILRAARRSSGHLLDLSFGILGITVIAAAALLSIARDRRPERPSLLWAGVPIKSLTYLSAAMRGAGYNSDTAVIELYPIVSPEDFDFVLLTQHPLPRPIKRLVEAWITYRFFAKALLQYDIFHYFFDGGVLQRTWLSSLELPLLRACGKKIVLMPYGSDSFVYDQIDPLWRQALLSSYPHMGNQAEHIQRRLRRMTRQADIVVATIVHITCLPRWDVLPVVYYPTDPSLHPVRLPSTFGPIKIAHAPNHRGAKGSNAIIQAVERLKASGEAVELVLIERLPHNQALERLAEADIVIDQLIFGYALTAIEAMAMGKVVVSGLGTESQYTLFRRASYLEECPIVPASPETIEATLRELIKRREAWPEIGRMGRAYVERRHSLAAARHLFGAIYDRIWNGQEVDLINLYYPRDRMEPS